MSDTGFGAVFARRAAISFFICVVLFFSCILRVAVSALTDYSAVLNRQSGYRLTVGKLRGTIYDRNMVPLTNAESKIIAAVSPTPRAVTAVSGALYGDELQGVLEKLKGGKPVLCEVPREIDCDGIACMQVYTHNSADTPAVHLLGYTDSDLRGMSGIEKAYDGILYSEKEAAFVYTKDGKGDILAGVKPVAENDSSVTAGGVLTTLDINIQAIAETEAEAIDAGAVIIADSKTSEIRAAVSRPDFDCTDIAKYLTADNSPLLNRALAAFNVGSVFKPCVAAAGMEAGKGSFNYNCTGSCKIIDRVFKCHKRSGHGLMTLKSGLANSCNTFFYNFAFNIGADAVFNMASSLNFGKSFDICEGIASAAGSLPQRESLDNIAYLANFSIGQGELLLSPAAMLTLYCAAAYDGSYALPTAVSGTLSGGRFTPVPERGRTRVMSAKTAKKLREYLSAVITEGTGTAARPKSVSAAGKTATAQTGKYENGKEICEGWFCGFFPADEPEYTVIVFSENISKQSKSCAEIFAGIADSVCERIAK